MEWQQLIGFYNTAKLKSFTRAAEATYRTQSALTQQIKSLEEEFACRFFERIGKRRVVLTPAGERLFRFAESLLLDYRRLREDIAEHIGLKRGSLRVAAPFTTLYHLLPDVIRRYSREFPWVELCLLDRPQAEVVALVKNGDVDFGIALEGIIPPQLNKRRWKKVEPVLLTRKGHPLSKEKKVSLEKIAGCPLILPPKNSGVSHRARLEELFRRRNLDYSVVMESSNVELSSLYVEMGLGVSFASIVRGLPVFKKRKLECISLCHILNAEYICAAARKDKQLTAYQKYFMDMLFSG
ncbi:MAG: LysR family transcriptional regulator [Nitrospirae bacterium]|nr:MAG: LysR family transcriptional regulator [Nitrospirota bacterium]